jgi:hypothetical protein
VAEATARVRRGVLLAVAGVLLAVGCGPPKPSSQGPPTTPAAPRQVYVALGGNETLNLDRNGDLPDDWTQLVFTKAFSTSAVHVNLASGDGTVQNALDVQLPDAVALHPTVATVWVGPSDVQNGTGAITFHDELSQLVSRLREAGARRVLLLSQPSTMPPGGSAYTTAVEQVARDPGAMLVRLGVVPFPLTDAGQRAIAAPVIAALEHP